MKCIIVESPAKAKKFSGMLDKEEYLVTSSFGHFRDLDKKCMSIDTETFTPTYIITNEKIAKQLRSFCKQVGKENIILGPDDDREGEAIGFHIAELLKIPINQTKRIKFNEISKKAILKALETPQPLDMNWVDSQQGRRIIDRLVGYSISPLLWQHIPGKQRLGLSAGRVQSATLKIIQEKEQEIKNYTMKYSFDITGQFNEKYPAEYVFSSEEKKNINQEMVEDILIDSVTKKDYHLKNHSIKQENKNPPPPFTTSTLQQEATNSGIPVSTTMQVAQKLYESGYITYMRTDSVNLSPDFIKEVEQYVSEKNGPEYFKSRVFKTKTKGAQEAHEAIRPTRVDRETLIGADKLQTKIYEMIYKRTIASQMATSILDVYTLELTNGDIKGVYLMKDKTIKFDGWQKIYNRTQKESYLTNIDKSKKFVIDWSKSTETPDSPPARFTEASIIKTLEATGIGRPSTFANILDTLYKREYIVKQATKREIVPRKTLFMTSENPEEMEEDNEPLTRQPQKNRLFITELGIKVLEYLLKHFDSLINKDFTSNVEEQLDLVASGDIPWKQLVGQVYQTFNPTVEKQKKECKSIQVQKNTKFGELNGKSLSKGTGRYGPYLLEETEGVKKGKFYNLDYYMKDNEKTLEEITLEDAKIVIENFNSFKNRKKPEGEKTYIKVKYADKNKVKALGAYWDKDKKSWYFCENLEESKKQELMKYKQ